MYQKKEKTFLHEMSSHLSQLNVMTHRNYFRRNLRFLKLATYTKIEDHYSGCKLAIFFRSGRMHGQMFIVYFVYTNYQVLLICNENKEICVANLMIN